MADGYVRSRRPSRTEAVCEAVGRLSMLFFTAKSVEQQNLQVCTVFSAA